MFDTGNNDKIQEATRIEFYPGKKQKDGKWYETGHYYWQWVKYKTKDGKKVRYRPYGGKIETVPAAFRARSNQYLARRKSRFDANTVFGLTDARVLVKDTGKG